MFNKYAQYGYILYYNYYMKLLICYENEFEKHRITPILSNIPIIKSLFISKDIDNLNNIIKNFDYIMVQNDSEICLNVVTVAYNLGKKIIQLDAGNNSNKSISDLVSLHLCTTKDNAKNVGDNGNVYIVGLISQTIEELPNMFNKYIYDSTYINICNIIKNVYNPLELHLMSMPYNNIKNINNDFAFVITTKITNTTQQYLLSDSISHIRLFYPTEKIYIINDNSTIPLPDLQLDNIELICSIVNGSGEINPYVFALTPLCKHETLIYIHDTVFIKNYINTFIEKNNTCFLPIWRSNKYLWDDMFSPINKQILTSMLFYYNDLKRYITLGEFLLYLKKNKQYDFSVTFGGMSIFNKSFCEFIQKYTNLFSILHLFTTRLNRCLFERILTCIFIWMHKSMYSLTVCGDINNHPNTFLNTQPNITGYNNYFLKVWQGR